MKWIELLNFLIGMTILSMGNNNKTFNQNESWLLLCQLEPIFIITIWGLNISHVIAFIHEIFKLINH